MRIWNQDTNLADAKKNLLAVQAGRKRWNSKREASYAELLLTGKARDFHWRYNKRRNIWYLAFTPVNEPNVVILYDVHGSFFMYAADDAVAYETFV